MIHLKHHRSEISEYGHPVVKGAQEDEKDRPQPWYEETNKWDQLIIPESIIKYSILTAK